MRKASAFEPRRFGLTLALSALLFLAACPEPAVHVTGDGGGASTTDSSGIVVDAAGDASTTGQDANTTGLDASHSDAMASVDHTVGSSDPFDQDNANKDSDCDGLSDQEEYANIYAGGAQTNPDDWDSDDDGLADGLELGRTSSPDSRCAGLFAGDDDPATTTNPTQADSDRDGLSDGDEDSNSDGVWDEGVETDPNHPDTDRDGLCDGSVDVVPVCTAGDNNPLSPDLAHDQDGDGVLDDDDSSPNNPDRDGDGLCDGARDVQGVCVAGEDINGDGIVNIGETDPDMVDTDCDGLTDLEERNLGTNPTKADSDGDLIPDGVELGRDTNLDPTNCPDFIADDDTTTTSNPLDVDSDHDGINDGSEDSNHDGRFDNGETDPANPDTDGDGLCDGSQTVLGSCVAGEDLNDNGIYEYGETDPRISNNTDGGSGDVSPIDPNNANKDSDCDGLSDAEEYAIIYAGGGQTDPANPDSDGDGLSDGLEVGRIESTDQNCTFVADADTATHTDPTNADTDGDGLSDGREDANHDGVWDQGNETNPRDPDTDDDRLCDGPNSVLPICVGGDPSPLLAGGQDADADGIGDGDDPAPNDPDRDGDGLCDGALTVPGTCVGGEDTNGDGTVNAGETDPDMVDTDCDGVSDGEERQLGLNPLKADTDGDRIADGVELGRTTNLDPANCSSFVADADPATTTDPLKLDSDDDGLSDGIEDANQDGEQSADETDPTNPDTDGDNFCDGPPHAFPGICTGGEDLNANGLVDRGETDPRVPEGAQVDAGPQDVNPLDPMNDTNDSDCDGLSDATEFATIYPGGGQTDPNNPDSDGDGILDGVELGMTSSPDVRCQNFSGDLDTSTHTDPLQADSDHDGLSDGDEDANHNGRVDAGETDPRDPDSDDDGLCDGDQAVSPICTAGDPDPLVPQAPADSDGDGILDEIENMVPGLDAHNADSDGDGINDGVEDANHDGVVNAGETDPTTVDTDCDGLSDDEELSLGIDPLKQDTDGDLINDGVEAGRTSNLDSNHCAVFVGDADNTTTTDPNSRDSDSDGLSDGIEDTNHNGRVDAGETDPNNADTDGDTLLDGAEDSNHNGTVDYGETDPLVPNVDSDGDGIEDLDEDVNNNGTVDAGETDPHNPDTDGDGLNDGDELFNYVTNPLSADSDCDGVSDGDEVSLGLDPLDPDSDADGLLDGIELGRTTNLDPALCSFAGDADPSTTTDPLDDDTDNDGVIDGAEDGNQNGRVDAGELDPNNPNDAGGVVNSACANPRRPNLFDHRLSDILLATSPDFAANNVSIVTAGNSDEVGRTVVDTTNNLVAFAVNLPPSADPINHLIAIESRLNSAIGGITVAVNQSFTSWDGYAAARATANLNNTDNTATALRKIVQQVLQDGSATVPVLNAPSESGPYKIGLEVVHRSANTAIVLGVITRLSNYDNASTGRDFRVEDFYAGTSLAQVGDTTGQQCDLFQTTRDQPVDIIWVIDDSGSMSDAQNAVNSARNVMIDRLNNSPLDWRIAVVTTYYWTRIDSTGSNRTYCDFMTTATDFGNCMDNIQASSRGDERGHQSLKRILNGRWLPAAANSSSKIRPDALVMVIFLSDAGDQSCDADQPGDCGGDRPATNDIAGWTAFAQGGVHTDSGGTDVSWDPNRTDEPPMIYGGILCPIPDPTGGCSGETDWDSYHSRVTYHDVINNMSGVIGALANTSGGSLADPDSEIAGVIPPMLDNLIFSASQYQLQKPPISASIKVAVDAAAYGGSAPAACSISDIPRSHDDGFSYDAATNRIAFFGACRPTVINEDIAASYYYWEDRTSDPDGHDQPPTCTDPLIWDGTACVCPADCGVGSIPDSKVCNTDPQVCALECRPDCGGTCTGASLCNNDDSVCACECPADCGGTAPGVNFVCDRNASHSTYCTWTCPDCVGTAPDPDMTCNLTTCEWACPVDSCAGGCPGLATCSDSSCDCECSQSITCDAGLKWDNTACDCVCDTAALNCGANYVVNSATCACDCAPDCNGNCAGSGTCITSICDCECPPDCGQDPMPAGFTCNTTTCELECQPDCGRTCPNASVCNNDNSVCNCECPVDCGGASPGDGFACDRDPASATFCSYICDACPGSPASAAQTCDFNTCTWGCPDCGPCEGLATCNDTSCACECQTHLSCDSGFVWDDAACDCVCDSASLGCSGNYVVDANLCACVCPEGCGGNCGSGTICNDSTCGCECAPDCGVANIPPEKTCDTASCDLVCRPDCGGICTGASVCNNANDVCACECPADCGGTSPGEGYSCDRDPASATYCQYICDACPGTAANDQQSCDLTTCEWTCPDHAACSGQAVYNNASCACECPADLTCASGYKVDQASCECVCDTTALGCDAKYDIDSNACACVCGANCNDQCSGGTYCNESLCACLSSGG